MSSNLTEARQRVRDTLNHKQPARVPMDFGSTMVTGIHVSVVAALREYYGLESRPVKVCDPYQMLGLVEEDLAQAMDLDVTGVFGPNTFFGFPLDNWKPWRMPDGLEVSVPGGFNTSIDSNGGEIVLGNRRNMLCASAAKQWFQGIPIESTCDSDSIRHS